MFKLRIALCLALIAGTLTAVSSWIFDARLTTIMSRASWSFIIFGVGGFAAGIVLERYVNRLEIKRFSQPKGQNIDIASEQTDEVQNLPQFSPFSAEKFEQIQTKQ